MITPHIKLNQSHHGGQQLLKVVMPLAGLYASFLKGQGHQGIFSLVKGTLMYKEIVNFYWSISRAPRQWPGGAGAIAFVAFVKYQACVRTPKTTSEPPISPSWPSSMHEMLMTKCLTRKRTNGHALLESHGNWLDWISKDYSACSKLTPKMSCTWKQ